MKSSATILVAMGLILGLAALAWAGGGWGYGPMMGRGAGWANGGGGWCGGPARMAAWNDRTATDQDQNQGFSCPGWNGYPGEQAQPSQNTPQTSPNPGDQGGR